MSLDEFLSSLTDEQLVALIDLLHSDPDGGEMLLAAEDEAYTREMLEML